jgi:hypothetical protein
MKKNYNRIKYIGYYQIIGGAIGIIMLLLNTNFSTNGFYLFVVSLYFVLCSFSVFGGILLLKKKHLIGIKFSIITQLLQILSFTLFGFIYDFAIGLYIMITIELTNDTLIGLDLGFFKGSFSRTANPELIELNINLIAIGLAIVLSKYYDEVKTKSNIGKGN